MGKYLQGNISSFSQKTLSLLFIFSKQILEFRRKEQSPMPCA